MRRIAWPALLLGLALACAGCQARPGGGTTPTPVETDACCLNEIPGLAETLAADQAAQETAAPAPTADQPAAENQPTASPPVESRAGGIGASSLRQGAVEGFLNPYQVEDVAAGSYPADVSYCGEAYLAGLPEESGEIVLTLRYAAPVLPERVEIFTGEGPEGIRRVELFNSASGLGRQIVETGAPVQVEPLDEGPCARRLILPARVDFEVDTIFIAFESPAAAGQVGAVELLGSLALYADAPVLWRVPLPGAPVDVAAGADGRVYVATGPNGLYAYDGEGRQLRQLTVPAEARLTGVEVDLDGNLVVTAAARGGYIILSPEGEQLAAGGQAVFYRAAVSPQDGNLYLLKGSAIDVYAVETGALVRTLELDAAHIYLGLAIDPQGRLLALRDPEWPATLLALDPLSGEELDAIPLAQSGLGEVVARDLAVDAAGNIYVLFGMNTAEIAVHVLDAHGSLIRRFGTLSSDPGGWPEGAFLDPRAIAASPDGRLILIVDGYEGSAFLTALLMEPP